VTEATALVDGLALALLAGALASVVIRDLVAGVWLLVFQSAVLALIAATMAVATGELHMWLVVVLTVIVRATIAPALLFGILRRVELRREMRPLLPTRLTAIGALGLIVLAFVAAGRLALIEGFPARDGLPVALSLTLLGLLLMCTRRKAISQVIGLITIENGIFLAGLSATLGLPLFVEIGVFFDLLVALTVLAVFTFRINEHFETVNTDALRELRG
jgi:hydrogenase-4 component E